MNDAHPAKPEDLVALMKAGLHGMVDEAADVLTLDVVPGQIVTLRDYEMGSAAAARHGEIRVDSLVILTLHWVRVVDGVPVEQAQHVMLSVDQAVHMGVDLLLVSKAAANQKREER